MRASVEIILKVKTCISGVKNAAACDELNKSHTDLGLDIHISPDGTSNNPGMKQTAKLCLTSPWGNLDSVVVWIHVISMEKMSRNYLPRKY